MKFSGTVAHNRCTVIRLAELQEGSWALPPNPEHRSSCRHGLKNPWYQARLKGRFALWYEEKSPHRATLLLLLENASVFRSKTVSSLVCKDTVPVKGEAGPAREREGTGPSMLWVAQQPPQLEDVGLHVLPRFLEGHYLCASTQSPNVFFKVLNVQKTYDIDLISKNKYTNIYTPKA